MGEQTGFEVRAVSARDEYLSAFSREGSPSTRRQGVESMASTDLLPTLNFEFFTVIRGSQICHRSLFIGAHVLCQRGVPPALWGLEVLESHELECRRLFYCFDSMWLASVYADHQLRVARYKRFFTVKGRFAAITMPSSYLPSPGALAYRLGLAPSQQKECISIGNKSIRAWRGRLKARRAELSSALARMEDERAGRNRAGNFGRPASNTREQCRYLWWVSEVIGAGRVTEAARLLEHLTGAKVSRQVAYKRLERCRSDLRQMKIYKKHEPKIH